MQISVAGGKFQKRELTLELQKKDPAKYAAGKAIFWLGMLQKRMKPTKWNKPNKNGTGIHFEMLNDQTSYDMAFGEFKGYLKNINEEYNLDLKLVDEKEE